MNTHRWAICPHWSRTEQILQTLMSEGIAPFSGIEGDQDFLDITHSIANRIGHIFHHRDSDSSGLTRIEPASTPLAQGYLGFSNGGLPEHTDRSCSDTPPAVLAMACMEPARSGGESLFADGRRMLSTLSSSHPELATGLLKPRAGLFDGIPRPVFESLPHGRLRLRYRPDALLKLTDPRAARAISQSIGMARHRVKLPAGHGFLLDNWRWLHGRTAFSGHRTMLRMLIGVDESTAGSRFGILPPALATDPGART